METEVMKPRGMGVIPILVSEAISQGKTIGDCPYAAKCWRSAWLSEFEAQQQMELFADGEEKAS